jgi:hypothetical protein
MSGGRRPASRKAAAIGDLTAILGHANGPQRSDEMAQILAGYTLALFKALKFIDTPPTIDRLVVQLFDLSRLSPQNQRVAETFDQLSKLLMLESERADG